MSVCCYCCHVRAVPSEAGLCPCLGTYCPRCLRCELHCACTSEQALRDILRDRRQRFVSRRTAVKEARRRARWRRRCDRLEWQGTLAAYEAQHDIEYHI
jgi:hypothetical protein